MLYIYDNLKYIREQLKLSKNLFASMLDINVSNISRWENKKNGMTLETAIIISDKLGIYLPNLLAEDLSKKELDLSKILNELEKEKKE